MSDPADMHGLFVEAHRTGVGGSPVAMWLLENAREFAQEVSDARRVNWARLAQVLWDKRRIGGRNGAVSGRALRDAWYRVRLYLYERGEDWVEFREPPRGNVRLVKRRKVAPEPVVAEKPAPAVAAPVSATPPDLRGIFEKRSWVPK